MTLGFCFFFVLELALPHEHHDHFDGTSALHIHAFSEHPNASRPEAGRLLPPAAELPQLDRAKATVVLLMDALHNLLDGIAIGIAWRYWQQGLALVIAIVLHEIGHEVRACREEIHMGHTCTFDAQTQMADYVFLVSQCGVSERAAAMWNLVGAGLSVAGALLGCVLGSIIDQADRVRAAPIYTLLLARVADRQDQWVLAVSAGGFLYISGTQLLPSLQKSVHPHRLSSALLILIPFGIGLGLLLSLAWFEDNIR